MNMSYYHAEHGGRGTGTVTFSFHKRRFDSRSDDPGIYIYIYDIAWHGEREARRRVGLVEKREGVDALLVE